MEEPMERTFGRRYFMLKEAKKNSRKPRMSVLEEGKRKEDEEIGGIECTGKEQSTTTTSSAPVGTMSLHSHLLAERRHGAEHIG